MIQIIKSIMASHRWIIVVAFLIGCISSIPQYLGQPSRPDFQGIYTGVVKDTIFYQARVKDVIDGHTFVTNPYLYEHKSGAPMQFWIPDYILAKPIQWLGVSVPAGYILWSFILPFFLALLSYAILLILTESRKWSVLGVSVLHIGLFALKFIRLPPHGLVFVFWLLALLFLLLFITKGHKKYGWGSAISFGMLFNVYPYYWTFFVVVLVTFFMLSFILRLQDFPYKKYFLIFGGGFVIGIPYFISLYKSSVLDGYTESLTRLGVISTHFPSGISTVVVGGVVVLIFIFAYWKKIIQINTLSVFLFSGVLGSIMVINQHLITGKNAEFSSHYMVGNMFWFAFATLYVIGQWLKQSPERLRKNVFIIFLIIGSSMAFNGAMGLIDQQLTYRDNEPYIQNYRSIFDWLNTNATLDEVVFANEDISNFLPIYTKQNIYYSAYSILFFMTNEEVEKRFVINNYFEDLNEEVIRYRQRSIFGSFYLNEYGHNLSKNKLRKLFGLPQVSYEMVPPEEIERIRSLVESIKKESFEKQIKTYKVDYIVWDSVKDPEWNIHKLKFVKEVYSNNGIFIFSINS